MCLSQIYLTRSADADKSDTNKQIINSLIKMKNVTSYATLTDNYTNDNVVKLLINFLTTAPNTRAYFHSQSKYYKQ